MLISVLALTTLACVRLNLSPPPAAPVMIPTPAPTPTPVVWPTLSPRSEPLVMVPITVNTVTPTCTLPDVDVGRHLSVTGSYTQTESATVEPMLCHIQRNSCAYDLMVGKLDSSIIYKQEETAPYSLEDFLIHPAMVQPLTRLNQLVQAEWGGAVQLRVTDAYDSLLEHDPPESEPETRYSLHYEGRAVDLTTWPVDRAAYGRLCALALCAGFDWVENEYTHCHASIKAPSLCTQC